jgi:hypothetical protein
MYTAKNYKTKKSLVEDFKAGKEICVFQPGPFGGNPTKLNGTVCLEGPWYPEPHRWYATATVKDGVITKVK